VEGRRVRDAAFGGQGRWARTLGCAAAATLVVAAGGNAVRAETSGGRALAAVSAFLPQGDKLTGGGESGPGQFGYSVALSADGTTALVGGHTDDGGKGAAWVFTRSGSTWSQLGSKLTGSGAVGAAAFGSSVALSADGGTALVGGRSDSTSKGAAWVFTRSGSAWNQQGAKLTAGGATGNPSFGTSAALSSDGNTALIGGPGDDTAKGAVWVFTRAGPTWTQQGSKLTGAGITGTDAQLGRSVALSADGNTAIAGGPYDGTADGAVWVFTRSGPTWTQQGSKLTGAGATGNALLGYGVALSDDGNTALAGGPTDDRAKGAAWVFTRAGTTWTQQGNKLVGTGLSGNPQLGISAALSGDGNTALLGGPLDDGSRGAAWVFTRSGSTWTQQGEKLTGVGAAGNGRLGTSVALADDGKTALAGGHVDNAARGAAWAFTGAPPSVSVISPASGPAAGGTLVKLTGSNLTGATSVKFGAAESPLIRVSSETEVTAVSPPGAGGTVDVIVTTPTGTSPAGANARFTYTAAPAPNPIVARIVYATVLQKRGVRTLNVRIRVSVPATAKVRLLRRGVQQLQRSFRVKGGPNNLKATIPRSLARATYQVEITLSDAKGNRRTYRTSVLVPARA
jgi:hypothetical protein